MLEHHNAPRLNLGAISPVLPKEIHFPSETRSFTKPKGFRDEPSRLLMVGIEHKGIEKRLITLESEDAKAVRKIVTVVGHLLRSRPDLYRKARGKQLPSVTMAGKALLACLDEDVYGIGRRLGDQQRLHPYFDSFRKLAEMYQRKLLHKERLPEILAEFLVELRSQCSRPEVRRQIDNAKRAERDNARSAIKLLREARAGSSKVLALRFDLEYLIEFAGSLQARPLDEDLMKRHREDFLTLLRSGPYAMHLVGYVWKTEWGLQRGFHHHVLVLLNGQKVCADIRIAEDLCMRWKHEITQGLGSFENCNKRKHLYRRCGIGMLARNDDHMWTILEEATRYITKKDVYTKSLLKEDTQCFGTGGPYRCPPRGPRKRVRLTTLAASLDAARQRLSGNDPTLQSPR